MTEPRDVNHTLVKRAVKCNSYTVDPDRVATALIVKLVQETLAPHPPATKWSQPRKRRGRPASSSSLTASSASLGGAGPRRSSVTGAPAARGRALDRRPARRRAR